MFVNTLPGESALDELRADRGNSGTPIGLPHG